MGRRGEGGKLTSVALSTYQMESVTVCECVCERVRSCERKTALDVKIGEK